MLSLCSRRSTKYRLTAKRTDFSKSQSLQIVSDKDKKKSPVILEFEKFIDTRMS